MNTWSKLRHLFDGSEGSLPDILVEGLSRDQVVAAHEWLMTKSRPGDHNLAWSIEEQRDVPLHDIPHPARAMCLGRIESFHHLLVGLSIGDVELPLLGVFVFPDELWFHYQTGPEWNEKSLLALFEVLRMVWTFAPQALISRTEEGARHDQRDPDFAEALEAYVSARST